MSNTVERNKHIDGIKGLAIICMVLGHTGFKLGGHIYLFHMAVFIMASGYCYNIKHSASILNLKSYIGKKLVSLYLPFAVFNTILFLLYNTLIKLNIYTTNPNLSSHVSNKAWYDILNGIISSFHFEPYITHELLGAAWFIFVLFQLTILFAMECWFLRFIKNQLLKNIVLLVSSFISLFVGYFLSFHKIVLNDFLSTTASCLSLYTIGYFLKCYAKKIDELMSKFKYLVFIIGIIFFYYAKQFGQISLNVNYYVNPLFLLSCSIVGWYWLRSIVDIFYNSKFIMQIISYIGQKTLFILFLHFLGFKVINLIQIIIYKQPAYLIASFPIFKTDGLWWIPYTIAGICIPLLIELLWRRFVDLIMKIDDNYANP